MSKKLLLVTTGGTISSRYDPAKGYSPVKGSDPALSAQALLGGAPLPLPGVEVEVWSFSSILSFSFTPEMVLELVEGVCKRIQGEEWLGAVVSQGTAMLEETPYLADLFWWDERPLVFTGAMFNGSEPDWDGPRNIKNALIAAASPQSRNKGALVCLGGEIHAARDVLKIHKTSLSPLCSPVCGPLGLVVNGEKAVYYRSPLRRYMFEERKIDPAVEIVKVAMGTDGAMIDALVALGKKAIVLEALPGGGGVTPSVYEAVKRNVDKAVFVMCPRSPLGSAVSKAGGGCGPVDLRKLGVITAGDFTSVKARVFLMAALPYAASRQELASLFEEVCP